MRTIDGSYGEGGGQLTRMACALAAITGEPVRLVNVRARRDPPGLAPQHLAAVKAVAALCHAETEGLVLRTQDFSFRPGAIRGGVFGFDVGTAGSVTLVLQALLPVALRAPAPVTLRITGGTDVRAAPPTDYLQFVMLPLLARLGLKCSLTVRMRGYYPRGGGVVEVNIEPGAPKPLVLDAPGPVEAIGGAVHVSNLPAHIAERMMRVARTHLTRFGPESIAVDLLGMDRAIGPGGACVLWARCVNAILAGSEVAQRGIPAEEIATRAAVSLVAELEAGASLDLHASDQVLVYLALAGGVSRFAVRDYSSHARTTAWLIEQFLPVQIAAIAQDAHQRIEVRPC